MTPLLSVRDLGIGFRTRKMTTPAIEGLSFDLAPGATLGIVGGAGSGKTTLARALLGILPRSATVTSGEILLDGVDLLKLSRARLREVRGRDVALVFSDPRTSLNPVLRVGRQITEALQKHLGVGKERARSQAIRLLERVGIPEPATRIDDYPHGFSDEMRQRVMIAMAIACRPKLLVADEPTASLDVATGVQISGLLRELVAEQGMALLLLTRESALATGICEGTKMLRAGRFVDAETVPSDDEAVSRPPSARATMRRTSWFGTRPTSAHGTERRPPVAGWGDDPELERLRTLIEEGWEVTEIIEDADAPGGPSDTVKLAKDGETTECTSDHLAFHRYVEGLREGPS